MERLVHRRSEASGKEVRTEDAGTLERLKEVHSVRRK